MTKYKLLAFDYDGTAAKDGCLPTERVRSAIAAARSRGVVAVLATGRPYTSAKRYAEALGLDTPVICFQGAMVRELADGQHTLFVEPTPAEAMAEIMALATERGLELLVYDEDAIFGVDGARGTPFYEHWFGVVPIFLRSFREIADRFTDEARTPLKAMFVGSPEENDSFQEELVRLFGDRLGIVRSHAMFVEVHSPRASKGHSLSFLAGHFGIAQSETVAVGDSGNDLSMIEWAGLGVAMGNARPDVLARADAIAPSVDDDGLAFVLERYFA